MISHVNNIVVKKSAYQVPKNHKTEPRQHTVSLLDNDMAHRQQQHEHD